MELSYAAAYWVHFSLSHSPLVMYFLILFFCLLKVNHFSISFISTLVGCIMLTALTHHKIKNSWSILPMQLSFFSYCFFSHYFINNVWIIQYAQYFFLITNIALNYISLYFKHLLLPL